MDLNKCFLLGHVGRDPVFHELQNGDQLAKFSVATSRKWKNKETGELEGDTSWHNIVVFNKYLVELTDKFIQKGTRVFIEGEVKTRSYEKDGEKKWITEIVVPQVNGQIIVVAKGKGWDDEDTTANNTEQYGKESGSLNPNTTDYDDDIPF